MTDRAKPKRVPKPKPPLPRCVHGFIACGYCVSAMQPLRLKP